MSEARGLVLAAGHGRRLRPLSDRLPKPLLPFAGVTLLDRAAAALLAAGCARVAVNTHHLADQIAAHLAAHPAAARLVRSHEPEILGTAGALDGARAFLREAGTIVVHNGDVLCDVDVPGLLADHRDSGAVATLALVDCPRVNSVVLGRDGTVRDVGGRLEAPAAAGDRALTFTGLACYDRAFLELVPAGRSELVPALLAALGRDPASVRGVVHAGQWEDLGTLTRYLDAHAAVLGPGFVSVAPGAAVAPGCELHECVVLAGARVTAGTRQERAVLGPGWAVTEVQNLVLGLAAVQDLGFDGAAEIAEIRGQGSDRRFWRVVQDGRRIVVMRTRPDDPELERTIAILRFLHGERLGAPEVFAVQPAAGAIVQEDLGPDTLNRLVHARPGDAGELYGRVLERLADLQTRGTAARDRCPLCCDRAFDREHLRWETDYFRQRFLEGHLGLPAARTAPLTAEFEALAAAVLAQPVVLVHRDLQSQNVLMAGGEVRLVDVQGMRRGPVAYDVMALLRDPYVDLDPDLRERLRREHPARLAARGHATIDAADWDAWCTAAGLQRVMQALGAYGFLAHVKGKRRYLEHLPRAVGHLRELLALAAGRDPGRPGAPPPLPRLRALLDEVGA